MTEKDAVKCKRFATGQEWYVPVEAKISSHASEHIFELLEQSFS
jgi:tetraacyldisaccharide-1-P 4'-kinase